MIALVLLVILAISGWWMRRHEQVLDRRGVQTEALMVEARDRYRRPDVAIVRSTVDGATYDTALIVDFAEDFRDRRLVTIEYDPKNLGHARPLEGWSPTYQSMLWMALIGLPLIAAATVHTWWKSRVETNLAGGRVVHHFRGAAYRRTRWNPYFDRQDLVALWPEHTDQGVGPALSVRVESGFNHVRPGRVTVVGSPTPGSRVVLRVDGRTVWTTGKLKAGIHHRAKPVEPG